MAVAAVPIDSGSGSRWKARAAGPGLAGERMTAAVLDSQLPAGWVALHGRRLLPDSASDIDHLVIGPSGVWVIDTKNLFRCRVYGSALWRRDARVDFEPLRFAADRVGCALGVSARPVICLVQQEQIDETLRDVRVVGLPALVRLIIDAP